MPKCKQPYTFVPVVTNDINTHEAIFHEGGNNVLLTGIIECTLTVKTPMLVGHYQYPAEQIQEQKKSIVLPDNLGQCNYHKDKTIIEPLFLGDGDINKRRVLINGASLKGMLRQTLGAITCSPMERVQDKQFGYRPGLGYDNKRGSRYTLHKATALTPLTRPGAENILKIQFNDRKEKKLDELDEMMIDRYWKSIETYKNKKKPAEIKVNDTIYVEYDNEKNKVVTFGNHKMYRWAYADTTTRMQKGMTGDATIIRPSNASPPKEQVDAENARLTAVRRLLGYVDGGKEGKDDDLNLDIGKEDYARLAGRIAINTAIEQNTNRSMTERFVQKNNNYNIPLKILAEPKASAVECYLPQSDENHKLYTYGDFPGFEISDNELAGRKFYYRWKNAGIDSFCTSDDTELAGNQAAIARYISTAGTTFKFTLRFKDLEERELGAVLAALSPQETAQIQNQQGKYWQQLGHGRPLGMGSVDIVFDKLKIFNYQDLKMEESTKTVQDFIQSFVDSELCHESSLREWLAICEPGEPVTYMGTTEHNRIRKQHIESVRKQGI